MKTEILPAFRYSHFPLNIVESKKTLQEKAILRLLQKEDFPNQRFAFINNESIHDPFNWDDLWFGNYE